ncbi:MAG: hypothetical protein FJW86_00295 [Actinobacteria bacterium]|nr:hypothetical protein [Actinomycetota bacterium]
MRGLAGRIALGVALLLLAVGCRPEIEFDVDGRQSQIDRVRVAITLDVAGGIHVEQRYEQIVLDELRRRATPEGVIEGRV